MKKRFWIVNAILSFLMWIWMFCATMMSQDYEMSMIVRALSFPLGYVAFISCFILVRNKKKSSEVPIASFNYEKEIAKKPQWAIIYPTVVRSLFVLIYSSALGFSSQCLHMQNDYLQTWLLLGILLLGGFYMLLELLHCAKKLGELDELDSMNK